jgi:D-alanine-D-alanine ligase
VLVRLKNKNAVNKILKKSGVLVPKVFRRQDFNTSKTDFRPVILKFATEHASFALRKTSIVKNEVELVREIIRYKKLSRAPVYIEEFVRGREISVAVMYIKRRHLVMRPMETVFLKSKDKAQEILTEKIKWDLKLRRQRKVVLRPVPDSEASLQNKVKHAAMKICRALEIDGPVRLDFRLAEDNKLYLIDANPNPDLGARFEFHESCRLDGISYGNMIKHIVNCALE